MAPGLKKVADGEAAREAWLEEDPEQDEDAELRFESKAEREGDGAASRAQVQDPPRRRVKSR